MKLLLLLLSSLVSLLQAASADDGAYHRMLNETDSTMEEMPDESVMDETEDEYIGCDQVQSGDLFIYQVDATDATESVSFMALEDLPGSLHLYITDYPWNGEKFLNSQSEVGNSPGDSGEGILRYITPEGGIMAGDKFNYSADTEDDWLEDEGSYDLAITGDSVFMYCMLDNETVKNLVGLSFDWEWAEANLPVKEYGTPKTSQPTELAEVGSIILDSYAGYDYVGDGLDDYTVSQKATMQQNMVDKANWEGHGYKHSGVGARELFTTATLALGVVGMVMI